MRTTQRTLVRIAFFSLLVLSCLTSTSFAQSTYGAIDGKVTDTTGAAVTGAKVEAVRQATGEAVHVHGRQAVQVYCIHDPADCEILNVRRLAAEYCDNLTGFPLNVPSAAYWSTAPSNV